MTLHQTLHLTYHGPIDDGVDIGVVEYDERALPAELEGSPPKIVGARVKQLLAGASAAGEREKVDTCPIGVRVSFELQVNETRYTSPERRTHGARWPMLTT